MSYPPYIPLHPQIFGFHQYPPPRFIPQRNPQQYFSTTTLPIPCLLPGDAAFEYFKTTGCLTPCGRIAEGFKHNGAQNLPLGLLQLDQISLLLSKHLDLKGEGPSVKDLLSYIVNELGKSCLNTPLLSLSLAGEGLFPLLASTGYFHQCLAAAGLTHFPLTPEELADQHDGSCRIAIQLVMHREGEQNLFLLKNAIRYFFKEANCPVQIKEESCGTSSCTLIFHQDSIHEISLHIIDDHKSPPVEAPYCFSIKSLFTHEDTEACYPEKGEHPLSQHFFNTASSLIALQTLPQNPVEEWLEVNRQLTCAKRFVDANARMEYLACTMQHGHKIEALCDAAGRILKSMKRNEAFCLAYQICLTAALPTPACAQLFALLPPEESTEETNHLQEQIIACLTKESVPFALVHGIVASCGLMQLHSSELPGGKEHFKLCRDGSSLGLQLRPGEEKCCLIPLFPGQILQQMLACHQTLKQSQMETFSTPLRHLYALLAPKAAFMQALPQEMQFLKHHYAVFKDLNDWANQLVCSGTPLLAHLGINLHYIPFLHGFGIPPEKDILDAFPEALALDLPEPQQKFLILNAETHLACHSNYKNSYLQKISRYANSRREDHASLNSRLLTFLCRETSVKRLRTAMRLWTRAYEQKEGLTSYAAVARDKLLYNLIGAKDLTSATEFLGFLVKKEYISGEKALEAFCMIANALIRKEDCPQKREHVAALASLAQPLVLKLKREKPTFDPVWTSVSFGWLVEQLLVQATPLLAADILLLASDSGLTTSKAIDLQDLHLKICEATAVSDPMTAAIVWQIVRKKQQWGNDRPAQEFVCQLAEKLLEAPLPEAAVFAQQCVTYLDSAKLLPDVAARTHNVTRELAGSLIKKSQFENALELIDNTTHLTSDEHIKFYLKIFKREAKNQRTKEALFALQKAASLADAPIKKRKIAAKALQALQQLLSHENANRNECLAPVYAVLADSKTKAILSADKSSLAETLLQSIELGIAERHQLELQDLSALLFEVLSLVIPNTQSHRNGKYLERTARACLALLKGTSEAKSALDPAFAMQFKRCHQQLFLGLMQADMPLLTISLAETMQEAISTKGWHKDAKYALLCAAEKLLKDNSLSPDQISGAENALRMARQISKNTSGAIVERETAVLIKLASLHCNVGNREQTLFHLKWMGRLNPEHMPEETYHELIRLALVCLKEYAEPHLALSVLRALKKCTIQASGEHINLVEELLAYFASTGEMETTLQILIDNRSGVAIMASVERVLPFVNKAVSASILTPTSKGLTGALTLLDSYPEAEPALLEGVLGVIAQGADSVNKQKAFALWKKAEATHLFEDQPERRTSCWCHVCALSPQLSALDILLVLEKIDEIMACVQTLAQQQGTTLHVQVFEAVAPLICEAKEFKLSVTVCAALLQARTELPSASSPEARHSKIDMPLLKAALGLNDLSLQAAAAALFLELARSSSSQRPAQELFPLFRQAIKQALQAKAHTQPKVQEMLCRAAELLLPGIKESSACYALAKDLSHLTHESRGTYALKMIQRGITLQIVPKTHKSVWIKHNAQLMADFKKMMAAVLPLLKDPDDCEAFLQVLAQPGGTLLLSKQDNIALTIQMTEHCLRLAQNKPEYSQEDASRAFALFLKHFPLVETNHAVLKPLFHSALELMLATLKRQQDISAYDKQYNALIGLLLPNEKKLKASGPNPAAAYYPYFSAVVHAHLSALTDGSLPSRECALAVYEKTAAEVSSCWLWFDYYNVKEGCNVMERFCSLVAPVGKIAHLERTGEILRFGCEKGYAQKAPHTIRNLLLMVNQLMVSFAQEPMGDPSQAVTISSNCSRNLIAAIEADLLSAATFHECFLSFMYLFPPSAYGDNQEHLKNIIALQQAANKKAYFRKRIDLYYQALLLATFSLPSEAPLSEKSRSAVIYAVLENLNRQPIPSAMIRAFEILKLNRDSLLPEHFEQSRRQFLAALSNLDTEPHFKAELCGMYLSVFGPDSAILNILEKLTQ